MTEEKSTMNAEIVAQPDAGLNPVMTTAAFNERWLSSSDLDFYGLWLDSPFRPFSSPYIEEPLDFLSFVTEEIICMDPYPDDDPDWLMDCQDYYDTELLLDFTGNLDAPL